jgi:hypothetical protein
MRGGLWIRETGLAAAIGIAATILCFVLFLALQTAAYYTPTEPIDRHLREGFENGDLLLPYSLPYDSDRGYHQRNDCLIYWMSRVRPDSLFSHLAAGYYVGDPTGRATYCETLRDSLYGDVVPDYDMGEYTRYLHGYRVATAFALAVLDVPSMRLLFKGLCYGLLLCTLLLAARRLLQRRRDGDDMSRQRAWAGVVLSIGFGVFYGLSYFGQSPSHAPAAWVIFLVLVFATQFDLLALGRVAFYGAVAAFGAFTAFFEYLTGAAPVGLAMLVGLMAFQGRRSSGAGLLIGRTFLAVLVFLGAIALSFLMNLVLNVAHFGTGALTRFLAQLSARTSTEAHAEGAFDPDEDIRQIDLADVFEALDRRLDFLGFGSAEFVHIAFVVALSALWAALLIALVNSRSLQQLVRVALALGPVAVTVLWYLAFQNHTVIHAAFMVRNLVWIPCAAALLVLVAIDLWRADPAAPHRQSRRLVVVGEA